MTSNRDQVLELVASLTDDTEAAQTYLRALVENPITPPGMVTEFYKIMATLEVQNLAVRRLNEMMLAHEDHMNDLIEKYTK